LISALSLAAGLGTALARDSDFLGAAGIGGAAFVIGAILRRSFGGSGGSDGAGFAVVVTGGGTTAAAGFVTTAAMLYLFVRRPL